MIYRILCPFAYFFQLVLFWSSKVSEKKSFGTNSTNSFYHMYSIAPA